MSLSDRRLERPDLVHRMMDLQAHRGPDEQGHYMDPSGRIILGHRRLKILDLETGQQPLRNDDGSLVVSFNGEIYGFRESRQALQARGYRFRTRTDTEVIVHLYADKGVEFLRDLKGMFAFALWDVQKRILLLARDRLGKKPLYYATSHGTFLFASELDALMRGTGLSRDLDDEALDIYLTFGYIPAPRTIYRHVRKLEAGHYLVVTDAGIQKHRYWSPQSWIDSGRPFTAWEDAREELIRRLRSATASRMVSDVPLGCFLSGGMDSSTVLSFMAELSSQPVKTFSIGFPEADYSELQYARTIARHFGADHHEYVLEPDGIEVLDRLVEHFGEPFADSSALPTWYLSELTRKSVTVALTGDGGDELFGGYGWYRTGRLLENLSFVPPRVLRLSGRLRAVPGPHLVRAVGKASWLLSLPTGQRYAALRELITSPVKQRLYAPAFLARSGHRALGVLEEAFERGGEGDVLNRMMAADLSTYLAEDLLVKVDRMSMAHALECRSPLLDSDLAQWVLSLPSHMKVAKRAVPWGTHDGKLLLRYAVQDRLPPKFLDRPKQGFSVPLERWFQNDLNAVVRERVLHGPLARLELFQPGGLAAVMEEHFAGRANHTALVWSLLMLAGWMDRYVG
jgi:asparagine synthase (glutamine-hydrolysing)